jgi:hypothetical protein
MAFRLGLLLLLVGSPAAAQYSGQPAAVPASPVDTWNLPPVRTVAGQKADKQPDLVDKKAADQKQKDQEEADRAKYVRRAPLSDVFALPNDEQLERAVLNRLRADEAARIDPTTKMPVDPYAKYPKTLTFPALPQVGEGLAYQSKTITYPPMRVNYEPLYVVHRRLHFEEKNAERYGWDLGIIQPLVSAAYFYKDVLLWPNSLASGVAYGFWDTNVGKCLPGSPTPYMLYPPGLTITGTVVEGLFVTGVAFAIP